MKIWKHIQSKLALDIPVYLITVIDNTGSTPGRKGFKMMVAQDGEIFGSIGGGVMEYKLVEKAKKELHADNPKILFLNQIHKSNTSDSSGMICSGEQVNVFHPLNKKDHLELIQAIVLINKGTLLLSPDGLYYSMNTPPLRFESNLKSETVWSFQEQLNYKDRLFIVGAGHVGLATTQLSTFLGFEVTILDNRKHLNTFMENGAANNKFIINYEDVATQIPEGEDVFIAVMTNKYAEDKLVLSQLKNHNVKYIGVLGSSAKLEKMFTAFELENIQFNTKPVAPIGIAIKSETPEEIAVSITAELIAIRNKGYK